MLKVIRIFHCLPRFCMLSCYGPAGVGKTISARHYANFELSEPLLLSWGPRDPSDAKVYAALAQSRAVFYTPTVNESLRELRYELKQLIRGCKPEPQKILSLRINLFPTAITFVPISTCCFFLER